MKICSTMQGVSGQSNVNVRHGWNASEDHQAAFHPYKLPSKKHLIRARKRAKIEQQREAEVDLSILQRKNKL